MRSARLKLHHHYLTSFDFVDKKPQTKKNLVVIPKLNVLIARSKLDKTSSEKYVTLEALVLELLSNQKTLVTKTDKIFSKRLLFQITLRKENLFLFLDSCLNTIFLHQRKFQVWDNIQVEDKLHYYLNINLINNFNATPSQFKYFLQLPNSLVLKNKINKDQSFYLIPTSSVKN